MAGQQSAGQRETKASCEVVAKVRKKSDRRGDIVRFSCPTGLRILTPDMLAALPPPLGALVTDRLEARRACRICLGSE